MITQGTMKPHRLETQLNIRSLGGRQSTEVALALPTQLSQVRFLAVLVFFQIWFYWVLSTVALLRESGQWKSLMVDWTHLVLVSGKLVLQKEKEEESPKPAATTYGFFRLKLKAWLDYWNKKLSREKKWAKISNFSFLNQSWTSKQRGKVNFLTFFLSIFSLFGVSLPQ